MGLQHEHGFCKLLGRQRGLTTLSWECCELRFKDSLGLLEREVEARLISELHVRVP